jgi:hypothetical protein
MQVSAEQDSAKVGKYDLFLAPNGGKFTEVTHLLKES